MEIEAKKKKKKKSLKKNERAKTKKMQEPREIAAPAFFS